MVALRPRGIGGPRKVGAHIGYGLDQEGRISGLLRTRLMRLMTAVSVVSLSLFAPASGHAAVVVNPGGGTPGTFLNFELVGHNPLFARGENAALAIFDHFMYIGTAATARTRAGTCDRHDRGGHRRRGICRQLPATESSARSCRRRGSSRLGR